MRSLLKSLILIGFFLSYVAQTIAQEINTTPVVTWIFETGAEGQLATYSDNNADYFKQDYVSVGSNLFYYGSRTSNGETFTQFQPYAQTGAGPENLISFNIRPKADLSFVPTAISFNTQRYGTDSGLIDVVWKSSDGTSVTLETGLKPARDNSGNFTSVAYDLSSMSIPASDSEASLEIYLYSLGDTKQVGFANVVIEGSLSGNLVDVNTYTLDVTVTPAGAGEVTTNPVGSVFDEATQVTLEAEKNFGYTFSHWADASDQVVSSENPYTFSITQDTTLKAVFNELNTYALNYTAEGGGKNYMITPSPSGTFVDNQRMYEEGVAVSLTAASNPILTFTNWSTGETSSVKEIVMDSDKTLSAVYSAVDYIVGWDFYLPGNQGRVADFFSKPDNESAALILRDAAGNTSSWLDKSEVAAGGYEGAPAAVNWRNLADKYYYQVSFSAAEFTDIKVSADMLYNYNAHAVQKVEYSLDGENFTEIGTYTMSASKTWYHNTFSLPSDANNAPIVYIRWIPDYSSDIVGATSEKDGTAISAIYITATEQIVDDGVAPVLVSSVPEEGGSGASATGKIVLTFDEKVAIIDGTTASLGAMELSPEVSGKSITFPYTGLEYNTTYTFDLGGNVVSDLSGNTLTDAISISFTTLDKPSVIKKMYDFIVGVDGDFAAALAAARDNASSGERFFIFFPDGEYDLGNTTGDATQQTSISIPNVSYIGESMDGVILYNNPSPEDEGIQTTPTINFLSNSTNIYMQDITILNKMDYRTGSFQGRAVALRDQGDKNIYKNVRLLSNQDTYFSGQRRYYFENSEIHGTVDFIFGGGDVFFNECLIYLEERSGNHITAAATSSPWGYVFSNCTIDGFDINNGSYKLGRPWQNAPKVVYLNTVMKVLPSAAGWSEWNVLPAVYAEYNSMTGSGGVVDLSNRRSTYSNGTSTTTIDPTLSQEQASQYTISNVLSGADNWQPKLHTEQAPIPEITLDGSTIRWADSEYVLGWAVIKDGAFIDFVTANSYSIPSGSTGTYSVRAANSMGGLSARSNTIDQTKNATVINWADPDPIEYGTPLSNDQLNASVEGNTSTPVYNPPAGTVLEPGTHILTVSYAEDDAYNAASMSVNLEVVLTTGLDDETNINLEVYPNPVEGEGLFIESAKHQIKSAEIITLNGQKVINQQINSRSATLTLPDLKEGTYILKIFTEKGLSMRKIIKL